jgi:uncharacterized membrane protein
VALRTLLDVDGVPVWLAALLGGLLLAGGAMVPYVIARAASGQLRRNHWVGIRTPSTMASDASWRQAHAAARGWAVAAGVVIALSGLGVLLVAALGSTGLLAAVAVGGAVLGAVLLVLGALRADAATRQPRP